MKVDEEGRKLNGLDQELGRKQADLHILTSDLESNQKQLVGALRDAESELIALKQKVKVCQLNKNWFLTFALRLCSGQFL